MAKLNILRTDGMLGYPVKSPQGERLGRVEEVLVDSETGRIVYAVVSLKEFLGTEDKLFAVPWRALTLSPEARTVILNVSRERMRSAPSFHREEWPDVTNTVWGSNVYRYYDYEPYWDTRRGELLTERHPVSPPSSYRTTGARSSAGWFAAALILLVVLGVAAYVVYPRETEVAAETIGRGAERAAVAVKETSEDAATTVKVKTALALSKQVSAFDVDVDSEDGVVTLEGEVPSESVKRVAAAIAEDTSGVKTVMNRLVVSPSAQALPEQEQLGRRVADVETRVLVREALEEDPDLAGQSIHVEVQDGVVILSGQVAKGSQRSRAEGIARGVAGVRGVVNQIEATGAIS